MILLLITRGAVCPPHTKYALFLLFSHRKTKKHDKRTIGSAPAVKKFVKRTNRSGQKRLICPGHTPYKGEHYNKKGGS